LLLAPLHAALFPYTTLFRSLHLAEGQNYELDVIWIAPDSTCQETPTGFEGAPELVVEVLSSSTAHLDKGHKFDAYERHGVSEYRSDEHTSELQSRENLVCRL